MVYVPFAFTTPEPKPVDAGLVLEANTQTPPVGGFPSAVMVPEIEPAAEATAGSAKKHISPTRATSTATRLRAGRAVTDVGTTILSVLGLRIVVIGRLPRGLARAGLSPDSGHPARFARDERRLSALDRRGDRHVGRARAL